jgi:outer membrane protein assembly factor BamB
MIGLVSLIASSCALLSWGARPPATDTEAWPQWGGPNRNFVVGARPLAEAWAPDGPRRRWRKPIGAGYSSIVTDGRTLYTLARDGGDDVVLALEAATGEPIWQSRYAAPFDETCSEPLGPVPRAAPLMVDAGGPRLIATSAGGLMTSFDRKTGARQWQVNLVADTSEVRACGYSASPVAFEDLVITTAGGKGRGVIAVRAATGDVAWTSQDFQNGYSSPLLIALDGRPEVVVFTYGEISGLDPRTGALEWTVPHPSDQGVNVATPIWGTDNLLFASSAYGGGSRVLRLSRGSGGKVAAEEVWANRRVRIHFGNAVRFGNRLYASNGDFGAAPFAAIDIATGDMVWRDRSVARSTVVGAGDRLLILDEDGTLALARPSDAGLTILAKAAVLSGRSWTAPTLSGSTLYLRNNTEIVALDLSPPSRP